MKKPASLISFLGLAVLACGLTAQHASAGIIQIDPSLLSGTATVDFEDLGLGNSAQVTFNTFESGFTLFGERFVGQTLSTSGDFDILAGAPTGPLTVVSGLPSQSVTAIDGGAGDVGNTAIAGSGPAGYPAANAVGEGSIAILFDFDQSEFGFDIVGGNGGTATAQFWARDGSLLAQIIFNLTSSVFDSFGFRSDDGKVIAGVSIFNNDPGGIGFDNFVSDVPGVPGDPGDPVPEPSTLALVGTGLMLVWRRARLVRSLPRKG